MNVQMHPMGLTPPSRTGGCMNAQMYRFKQLCVSRTVLRAISGWNHEVKLKENIGRYEQPLPMHRKQFQFQSAVSKDYAQVLPPSAAAQKFKRLSNCYGSSAQISSGKLNMHGKAQRDNSGRKTALNFDPFCRCTRDFGC